MAWIAVDKDGGEYIYNVEPTREPRGGYWVINNTEEEENMIQLPKGSIKKLIGWEMTWQNESIQL